MSARATEDSRTLRVSVFFGYLFANPGVRIWGQFASAMWKKHAYIGKLGFRASMAEISKSMVISCGSSQMLKVFSNASNSLYFLTYFLSENIPTVQLCPW